MAEITASMVKKGLRERTQAGMMDCKNALKEANGDMALAAEVLAKKGLSKVSKAAGKIAAQGAMGAAVSADQTTGVLVELNCQTDFVSRGEDFSRSSSSRRRRRSRTSSGRSTRSTRSRSMASRSRSGPTS